MMADCDTLLMVGSGFPYTEFLPEAGQARAAQIDIDPGTLRTRYPMEVDVGDSAETLRALLPLLTPRTDTAWRNRIAQNIRDWDAESERRSQQPANPVNLQRLFRELSPKLPDNGPLAADSDSDSDSGSSTIWYARDLQVRSGCSAPSPARSGR